MTFRTLSLLLLGIVIGCNGCNPSEKPLPPVETPPLSILVVEDESLAETIRRELSARADEKITVDVVTPEALSNQKRLMKDILIYPPDMMGELIQRDWIVPVPTTTLEQESLALDDIVQGIRLTEIRWGSKTYALPIGSPVLMLMVRADVLKELGLPIPKTWKEYATTVAAIQESDLLKGNETFVAATLEPLDDEYLPELWLARSAAYVKHNENLSTYFDFSSGKARIDTPGFTRAAEELMTIAQSIPDDYDALTPQATAEAFLAGKSVMAIGWINKETIVPETVPSDIQFAPIPGSTEIYQLSDQSWKTREGNQPTSVPLLSTSGMVGSVTSASGQTLKAADLLVLLTGPELISLISPASERTTMCRVSSLPMAEAWLPNGLPGTALRQYAQISIEQLQSPRHLSTLRIPTKAEYFEVIGTALKKTNPADPMSTEAAWKEATRQWDAISEKQGQDAHVKAFRNSQGIGDKAF